MANKNGTVGSFHCLVAGSMSTVTGPAGAQRRCNLPALHSHNIAHPPREDGEQAAERKLCRAAAVSPQQLKAPGECNKAQESLANYIRTHAPGKISETFQRDVQQIASCDQECGWNDRREGKHAYFNIPSCQTDIQGRTMGSARQGRSVLFLPPLRVCSPV